MATHQAVICIPDITGFTNFVNKIEIQYAQKIIPVILRSLVSSNILDFEVAEIQGDAVLFYRTGEPPTYEEILKQSKMLYDNFRYNLNILDRVYGEKLLPYNLTKELGLKIVVHYGEVGLASVVGNTKLYGQDVIIALELLKNNIKQDEYLLLSDRLLEQIEIKEDAGWGKLEKGSDHYDKLGTIHYRYLSLDPLKQEEFKT